MPSASSFGQVVFIGLHFVQVWAMTGVRKAEAPSRRDREEMRMVVNECEIEE